MRLSYCSDPAMSEKLRNPYKLPTSSVCPPNWLFAIMVVARESAMAQSEGLPRIVVRALVLAAAACLGLARPASGQG
jgi:hypothetical protein